MGDEEAEVPGADAEPEVHGGEGAKVEVHGSGTADVEVHGNDAETSDE